MREEISSAQGALRGDPLGPTTAQGGSRVDLHLSVHLSYGLRQRRGVVWEPGAGKSPIL